MNGDTFYEWAGLPPPWLSKEADQEKLQEDDTAPGKEAGPCIVSTSEIIGNESTSVLRRLTDCFSGGYHYEWASFFNRGFPASQEHRRMFWHLKYRTTEENHYNMWYKIEKEDLMKEYINRDKDEDVLELLTELRNCLFLLRSSNASKSRRSLSEVHQDIIRAT